MNGEVPGADAFGRLTRKDAAELLGYSEQTLANWAVEGIGPKPRREQGRARGRVFYLANEVAEFALGRPIVA